MSAAVVIPLAYVIVRIALSKWQDPIRQARIHLAQSLLPKDLTTTGVGEQKKLVDALRDALKEVSRLADYASQLEGKLGLIPKIERKP